MSLRLLYLIFVRLGGWLVLLGRTPAPATPARPPRPGHPVADLSQEQIKRRPVLGGLLNEYERAG